MSRLSPEAQAVLDAYHDAPVIGGLHGGDALGVAAALRAVAAQIEPTQQDRAEQPEIHSQVFFNGISWSAVQLRSIAAELGGQS